jgi:hypothetical protein
MTMTDMKAGGEVAKEVPAGRPDVSTGFEERARTVLAAQGFPDNAVSTFRLGYTSWTEIEAGGGRFYYFR